MAEDFDAFKNTKKYRPELSPGLYLISKTIVK
jgi:hypothetical protein